MLSPSVCAIRLVNDFDRFAIEEQLLFGVCIRVGRPGFARGFVFAVGRAHAVEECLIRDNRGTLRRARPDVAHHIASRNRHALPGDRFVAANVIRMDVRINDVADGLLGDRADGCEDLVAVRSDARIDEQDPIIARLHRDVAARADDHVNLPLHVHDVKRTAVGNGRRRRVRLRGRYLTVNLDSIREWQFLARNRLRQERRTKKEHRE